MKSIIINRPACLILLLFFTGIAAAYSGSTYKEIYNAVFESPYTSRPTYEVNSEIFGPPGDRTDNLLLNAARSTLKIQDDLREFTRGQKLLQPNGICFSGTWKISETTEYTGQYSMGTSSLAIVRASVSLGGTKIKDKRAFSIAVKLFPTFDTEKKVATHNLLVMESISGVRRKHFLDAVMDNAPPLGGMPSLGNLGTSVRIYNDMKAADNEISPGGANLAFRPVTSLAKGPNTPEDRVNSPRWVRLSITNDTPRINADDFRDELDLNNYPGHVLNWKIEVADESGRGKSYAVWKQIGILSLTESVTSKACDARLHFAHPVYE